MKEAMNERTLFCNITAQLLRKLRGDRTQLEVARLADIPQSTLSRYENAQAEPSPSDLRRLCNVLGSSLAAFALRADACMRYAMAIAPSLKGHIVGDATLMGIAMAAAAASFDTKTPEAEPIRHHDGPWVNIHACGLVREEHARHLALAIVVAADNSDSVGVRRRVVK